MRIGILQAVTVALLISYFVNGPLIPAGASRFWITAGSILLGIFIEMGSHAYRNRRFN